MRPDPEYTRKLLRAFQEAPEPTTDIRELKENGLDYNDKEFMFHLRLLYDDDFVEQEDGNPGIGLVRSADGLYQWSVVPLRLTASGQEFAAAIENEHGFNAVKEAIKKNALPVSLDMMKAVAVQGVKAFLVHTGVLPPG